MTARQINAIVRECDGRNVYAHMTRAGTERVIRVVRARSDRFGGLEVRALATGRWVPVEALLGDRIEVIDNTRGHLIAKLQDAYHYALAATANTDERGRESTFTDWRYRTLAGRLANYDRAIGAWLYAQDVARALGLIPSGGPKHDALMMPASSDFETLAHLAGAARRAARYIDQWAASMGIDAYGGSEIGER